MVTIMRTWLHTNCKAKSVPPYSIITLLKISMTMLATGSVPLDVTGVFQKKDQDDLMISYKHFLFFNLRHRLRKPEKLQKTEDEECMSLSSTLEALEVIDMTQSDIKDLQAYIGPVISPLKKSQNRLAERLEMFLGRWDVDRWALSSFDDIVTSLEGRLNIRKWVLAASNQMTNLEKLRVVNRLLKEVVPDGRKLTQLLTIRQFIDSYEGKLVTPSSATIADYC